MLFEARHVGQEGRQLSQAQPLLVSSSMLICCADYCADNWRKL